MEFADAGASMDSMQDFTVHKGLPKPESVVEELSGIEKVFADIYHALEKAISEQNPDAYTKGICDLAGSMRSEISDKYMSSSGDLGNTMTEWASRSPYPDAAGLESLKAGKDIVKRTSTKNNSGTPHGTGNFVGDLTDSGNSQRFGDVVASYVNERGRDFITAQIVPGKSEQREPVSIFQVETTLRGYHPRTIVE